MEITRAETVPSLPANAEYFTGAVRQERIVDTPEGPPVMALRVAFEPGARTNWHTHPAGQTLHVLSGTGIVQRRGAEGQAIRPGDTVWIPAGEEHWHGAAPGRAMTHLAMQAKVEGSAATWLEPVSDTDYEEAAGQAGLPAAD